MQSDHPGRPLKTVETTLNIINLLHEQDGLGLDSLARELGKAKSTVHGHVKTLEKHGYVVNEDDTYYLGMQFLNRGGYVANRKQVYVQSEAKVEQLAEKTGERAQFIVEEHGKGIYVRTEVGNNAVITDSRRGKRTHLHIAAAGKSILANLSEERVKEIVDRWGLPKFTPQTITDRAELFNALEDIRDRGYAFSREETVEGLRSVGAPVITSDGRVVGAFSVSGPTNRMKDEWFETEIPDLLLGVTNEFELNLQYQNRSGVV